MCATIWIFPNERGRVSEAARINEGELLVTAVVGDVTSPSMAANPYEVDADGRPVVPIGMEAVSDFSEWCRSRWVLSPSRRF